MSLRDYLEEYLNALNEVLQKDDSEIRAAIDEQWPDEYDIRRVVFLQPATRFGKLSTDATGSETGFLTNEMPPGCRAHVEKYVAETQQILQTHPNADEQTLKEFAGKLWGHKDARFLAFIKGLVKK
ncbi:hypothetical protein BGP_0639 [Beggiatoa sp. PS]|nr:hypothetical protein BGP_0639 [Beggiatoa sp. PS]